jgi:hypothetical protein
MTERPSRRKTEPGASHTPGKSERRKTLSRSITPSGYSTDVATEPKRPAHIRRYESPVTRHTVVVLSHLCLSTSSRVLSSALRV